jgi:biopolymer transport protein ExbD
VKRSSIFARRHSELDVKMTPMIDVVFLLLIFFVWTASFQIVEQVLPSNLTAASGSQPSVDSQPPPPESDFDDIVIKVHWNAASQTPSWEVNDTSLDSLANVRDRLKTIGSIKRDAPIFILPDEDAPMLHVIDVYDAARLEQFPKVNLAIRDRE